MKSTLTELNENWKEFLGEHRLVLMMGLEKRVSDFLYKIEFSSPNKIVYNKHMKSAYTIWEIVINHPTTEKVKSGEVSMYLVCYNTNVHLNTQEWVIYPQEAQGYLYFTDYFFESIDTSMDKVLNDLFNEFDLHEKIQSCLSTVK